MRAFPENGLWLKGNLHAHSTLSDGELEPEAVLRGYRDRGYDFISLTDHDVYSDFSALGDPAFLVLPGLELSCFLSGKKVHVNLVQKGRKSQFAHFQRFSVKDSGETERILSKAREDYIVILNHPDWSLLEYADVKAYECIDAVEVFNYGTELCDRLGESTHFWESALRDGKRWKAIASDDSHFGYRDQKGWPFSNLMCDGFGGWVMVKAEERTAEAVTKALAEGSFYASSGPEIHDFRLEHGFAYVSCSPVSKIIIKGERRNIRRKVGESLTEAVLPLRNNKSYVRVECVDKNGRVAYSNPLYLEDE